MYNGIIFGLRGVSHLQKMEATEDNHIKPISERKAPRFLSFVDYRFLYRYIRSHVYMT